MGQESRHGSYFLLLLLLMVSVLILSAPLAIFYVSVPAFVNYIITGVVALVFGHISARFIEKITHKEKKEVLAGTVIPLPAVIGLTVFLVFANSYSGLTSLNALFVSLTYFVCFNLPFLAYFYEHEKHKHHLVGFLVGVMFVALAYSLAFFVASSLASYSVSPVAQQVLSSSPDYSAVSNFVTGCVKVVAKEKLVAGYSDEEEFGSYIDNNLGKCINGFSAFSGQNFLVESVGSPESSVLLANSTVAIQVYYPLIIREGDKVVDVSKFEVILER